MKKRYASVKRTTNETTIEVHLSPDGTGKHQIDTPIGFLNHMLELFTVHGQFDLTVSAKGDIHVDEHHVIEDIGIVLGQALAQALGDKRGINRYGFFILPMDEALATVALDCGGRYAFAFDCPFNREIVGDFPTELVYDFWDALAQQAKMNVHIKVEHGRNAHHQIEAIFKAVARALQMSCALDLTRTDTIPSTKGML